MSQSNDEESLPWHKNEPCILGIDEAGRGPVLGPMVYTAAYCAKSSMAALNALGADDSKQLTEEQRDKLRAKIDAALFLRCTTRVLSAQELSEKMLRKAKYNLNLISHDTALELVETAMEQGVRITEVYVDTVGDPERYAVKFRNRFPGLEKVVVAKKADSTYRIVGAASIVAKTTRDQQIRQWVFPEQERSVMYSDGDPNSPVRFSSVTGSGYPSDPSTKAWMEGNCDPLFGFPTFVRFSWATTRVIIQKKAVGVEWECDDEDDDEKPDKRNQVKTKDIKSFFTVKPNEKARGRPAKQRKLSNNSCPMPKFLASMSLQRASTFI